MPSEVFIIEDRNTELLFAPLRGLIFELKRNEKAMIMTLMSRPDFSFEKLLPLFPTIDQSQLLQPTLKRLNLGVSGVMRNNFKPDSLVLFTTFDCNFRCIYCYSKGGERKLKMRWQTAKTAIDFVVKNAKINKREEVILEFHGGGEPTFNWPLFQTASDYFQKQSISNGLLPKVNLSTNGFLNQIQTDWIIKHISSVQVSLDGMKEIQNYQRPRANGRASFEVVCKTIKSLLANKIKTVVRCTVTEKSVSGITEIVTFLMNNFHGATVHLEPVCECGRGLQTGQKFPSPELFISGFIEAEKIAEACGSELFYSGASSKLTLFRRSFCGISAPNFIVTPTGAVSACHEVAESNHPLARHFIYGCINHQNGTLAFDYSKIQGLKTCVANVDSVCEKCHALYYCAGECLAKKIGNSGEARLRCKINQELIKHYVFKKFFRKEVIK